MTSKEMLSSAPAYDALGEAKRLLRTLRSGALASVSPRNGHPFASLVNVATDSDGSLLLLLSTLAAHTRNLAADGRCSILLAQGGKGDPLAHPRLTVSGRAARDTEARARKRFLARHPKSAMYADFADFSFWRVEIESAHLNGGFARAADFGADEVKTNLNGAEALLAAETDALEHMNADHAEALRLYATVLADAPDGPWRAFALDPEGIDLTWQNHSVRIAFPQRVCGPGELRTALVELAAQARKIKAGELAG